MSKPTAKQVVDALRCTAFGGGVPCDDCYFLCIEDGNRLCSVGGIVETAADMIEAQAARIRELDQQPIKAAMAIKEFCARNDAQDCLLCQFRLDECIDFYCKLQNDIPEDWDLEVKPGDD